MFAMRPRRLHAMRKRMLWRPYTKTSIASSAAVAQIIESDIYTHFRNRLDLWSRNGSAVNVLPDCLLLAYMVSVHWVFGMEFTRSITEPRETGLQCADAFFRAVPMDTAGYLRYQLGRLWSALHLPVSLRFFGSANAARELAEKATRDMCSAEARSQKTTASDGDDDADGFFSLCRHLLGQFQQSGVPESAREQLLASELMDHILPAVGALGLTLMYAMFELSKYASVQNTLRDELVAALGRDGQDIDAATRASTIDGLPQLNSVILETLRVHIPAKTCFPREVPKNGAQLGSGTRVPGGVVVSSSAYWSHMDSTVYESPEEWRPQRWLTLDQDHLRRMERSLWPFGRGPTMCIARHLAMRGKPVSWL